MPPSRLSNCESALVSAEPPATGFSGPDQWRAKSSANASPLEAEAVEPRAPDADGTAAVATRGMEDRFSSFTSFLIEAYTFVIGKQPTKLKEPVGHGPTGA